MKVGICAIIKDCRYSNLNEWLEWHRLLGVDYFFIYDNESLTPIISWVENKENVTVIPFPGRCAQLGAYNDCIQKQRTKELPKCDWIAFIDDDEFLTIESGDIKSFLSKQKGSGVGLNWLNFGSYGDKANDDPQIDKCIWRIPINSEVNKHIKSIVRPEKVEKFVNPHFCTYKEGKCLDVVGRHIPGAFVSSPTESIAWINHYYCRSFEEFQEKIKKGRVDTTQSYNSEMYHLINDKANECTEKIIQIRNQILYPGVVNMRDYNGSQGLMELIDYVGEYGDLSQMTMIEIGAYAGDSTVIFAEHFGKVITIDPFVNGYDPKDPTSSIASFELVYKKFQDQTGNYDNIEVLKMTSDEAISHITCSVDFVYIDGNHSYEQVKKDIENYKALLSTGSLIGGHDYWEGYEWIGVKQAVNEAFKKPDKTFPDGSWIVELKEPKKPIALLTPTGGRPDQIKKCTQYMKSQTYSDPVVWVIVDDCIPITSGMIQKNFRDDWEIVHLHPSPFWKPGDNTQGRNLKAGLEYIQTLDVSAVFIIEDDDYYTPKYLSVMTSALEGFDVIGETETLYYNVNLRREKKNTNQNHSSLFQTAFTPKMIPTFLEVIKTNVLYFDIEFFKRAENIQFLSGLYLAVGIKGLPGRQGIGNGHTDNMYRTSSNTRVLPAKLRQTIETIYNGNN